MVAKASPPVPPPPRHNINQQKQGLLVETAVGESALLSVTVVVSLVYEFKAVYGRR